MSDTGGFEGEDAKFFKMVVDALPEGLYRDHEVHISRMLHSSPYPEPWSSEATMLRMGLRRSSDSRLQTPRGAASVITDLVETLSAFRGDKMEEWFFEVLEGLATHSTSLVTFSSYGKLSSGTPLAQGRVDAPAGSDVSEMEEDRDEIVAAAGQTIGSGSEYEADGGGGGENDGSDGGVEYLSTGEVYV